MIYILGLFVERARGHPCLRTAEASFMQKRFPNSTFAVLDPVACSPEVPQVNTRQCSLQSGNTFDLYESSSWEYAPLGTSGTGQAGGQAHVETYLPIALGVFYVYQNVMDLGFIDTPKSNTMRSTCKYAVLHPVEERSSQKSGHYEHVV
ncbi:hypothetical protein BGW80DRAFT_689693 [Lactifluus volemus]|nr:hypothetical protein BGW80DRAFT_689693 [Lactifluus volemus]